MRRRERSSIVGCFAAFFALSTASCKGAEPPPPRVHLEPVAVASGKLDLQKLAALGVASAAEVADAMRGASRETLAALARLGRAATRALGVQAGAAAVAAVTARKPLGEPALPAGYAARFIHPAGARVQSVVVREGASFTANLTVPAASVAEGAQLYRAGALAKGWSVKTSTDLGTTQSMTLERGAESAQVTVSESPAAGTLGVNVNYSAGR